MDIKSNLSVDGDLDVAGVISGDGSGLSNLPASPGGGWTLIDTKTSTGAGSGPNNGTAINISLSGSYSSLLILGSVWAGSGGTEVRMTVNGNSSSGNYGQQYYYAENGSPTNVAWSNWGYVVVAKEGANYNYPTQFIVEIPLFGTMVPGLGGAFTHGFFRFTGYDTDNVTRHGWGSFRIPVPSSSLEFVQQSGLLGANSTIKVYGL